MNITLCAAVTAATLILAGPTMAQDIPPEIDVMQRIASAFDEDGDDKISAEEFREFTRTAWRSMDTAGDGTVSKDEFMLWDPGFIHVAAMQGKTEDFSRMKEEIFKYWDNNGDGTATKDEVMATADAEFKNSDHDSDGFVSGRDLAFGSPTFAAFIFGAGPASD